METTKNKIINAVDFLQQLNREKGQEGLENVKPKPAGPIELVRDEAGLIKAWEFENDGNPSKSVLVRQPWAVEGLEGPTSWLTGGVRWHYALLKVNPTLSEEDIEKVLNTKHQEGYNLVRIRDTFPILTREQEFYITENGDVGLLDKIALRQIVKAQDTGLLIVTPEKMPIYTGVFLEKSSVNINRHIGKTTAYIPKELEPLYQQTLMALAQGK